jgi:ectoine hydroxylase-related dioxygenase (phytanoyl-CoA dioxygenase family)
MLNLEKYLKDGYVLVPSLFTEDECIQLTNHGSILAKSSDNYCVPTPFRVSSAFASVQQQRRLVDCVKLLIGEDASGFGGELFLKPPGQSGFPAHYDNQSLKLTKPGLMCTVWIALKPVDRNSGGLWLYPGSHLVNHKVQLSKERSPNRPNIDYYEVITNELDPAIYSVMNTGDVIFFHGNLIHYSQQNRSTEPRASLQLTYVSASSDAYGGMYQKRTKISLDCPQNSEDLQRKLALVT